MKRDKHLKCDGQALRCSRCRSARFQCIYVPSRRGARAPRNNTKRARSPDSPEALETPVTAAPCFSAPPRCLSRRRPCPRSLHVPTPVAYGDASTTAHSSSPSSVAQTPTSDSVSVYRNPFASGTDAGTLTVASTSNGHPRSHRDTSLGDRCFDAFYHYFHAAHPLMLRRQFFLDFLGEGVHNLEHLVAAMKYIGSLFIESGPSRATFLRQALRLSYLPSTPKGCEFTVVRTLLLAR